MRWIFLFLIIVLSINYLVDVGFYLRNRFCRYHIGRWESFDQWVESVEKCAVRWLYRTPTVKITDNSRYILLDCLKGKYKSDKIQSWQKAALILGLSASNNPDNVRKAKTVAMSLLSKEGTWKTPPEAVDCGMLAFALLTVCDDPLSIKPAMDYSLKIIEKNMNREGIISYAGGAGNPELYVDTLGLVCPFLTLYARTYNVTGWEDVAFKQLETFRKHGVLEKVILPNHAFNIDTKLPLGVYGWGRGAAWYLIGLLDTYNHCSNDHYKRKIREWMNEAIEAYLAFQREDGGFGSILQRKQTYDGSATVVMAWFFASLYHITGDNRCKNASEKCMAAIKNRTRISGAIDWCQGDTKEIGVFSQIYDIMPFAQGMVLRGINKLMADNHE